MARSTQVPISRYPVPAFESLLHGFDSVANAKAYLESALFNNDVVTGLKLLLAANSRIRIYEFRCS